MQQYVADIHCHTCQSGEWILHCSNMQVDLNYFFAFLHLASLRCVSRQPSANDTVCRNGCVCVWSRFLSHSLPIMFGSDKYISTATKHSCTLSPLQRCVRTPVNRRMERLPTNCTRVPVPRLLAIWAYSDMTQAAAVEILVAAWHKILQLPVQEFTLVDEVFAAGIFLRSTKDIGL